MYEDSEIWLAFMRVLCYADKSLQFVFGRGLRDAGQDPALGIASNAKFFWAPRAWMQTVCDRSSSRWQGNGWKMCLGQTSHVLVLSCPLISCRHVSGFMICCAKIAFTFAELWLSAARQHSGWLADVGSTVVGRVFLYSRNAEKAWKRMNCQPGLDVFQLWELR